MTFADCLLSPEIYQVDVNVTEAISKFPTPVSHTELHTFFGLVDQLTSGINKIKELMSPLRPRLSIKNNFIWSADHALFSKVKEQLVMSQVSALFDFSSPTRLSTDTSRQGLDFVVQQQSTADKWTLVQVGSISCLVQNLDMLQLSWRC